MTDVFSNSFAAPYAPPSPHLFAVMLLAKHESGGDATLVSSIAIDEASALNGAREQNLKFHPVPEWSEHTELPFLVPDQLILQISDILRGRAPGMTQQQDPFAGIPAEAPPTPIQVQSFGVGGLPPPLFTDAPPPPPVIPSEDIRVSYPPGVAQFDFQKP